MKFKFIIYICFSVVLFCSCNQKKSSKIQPSERDIAMDTVLVATANQLSEKYKVRCIGFSYGCFRQIEELGLRFTFSHIISSDEARKFLVDGAQIMVKEVRNNSSIQPYLSEQGFDVENVSIIAIVKDNNKDSFYPNLTMIMLDRGEIDYSSDDPEIYQKTQIRTKKTKIRETFAEALALVNENKK